MTTILTTTGISLHNNGPRLVNTKTPTDDQMRQYLRQNPRGASAETNSLLQMSETHDHLILLHTQEPIAIRCVHLLQEYFENEGYAHVSLVPLGIQSDAKHMETTGLRDFINAFINEIDKARRNKQEILINATAGFKSQVVYSTMIGMIHLIPVKYLYEDFKSIVTFNPIAVDWDTSLFLVYDAFFRWIDEEPRTYKQVEQYLEGYADREQIEALLTSPDENGTIFLSYMGGALRSRFLSQIEEATQVPWPESANVPNSLEKIASSIRKRNHHPVKGDLEACKKIAALDCVQEIIGGNYEPTLRTALKQVYDDGTILMLWSDNEKASRFTIRTTAKGKLQTLKVAQKIKEILEID